MNLTFPAFIRNNYRSAFGIIALVLIFYISLRQNYLLFHSIVELFSIVVAFAVFIVTWNSRKMLDNNYLYFVGISYLFIGALDLLHTLTFKGMGIFPGDVFYANQFWVATRALEALTLTAGFTFLGSRKKKLSAELIFICYFIISTVITCTILVWHIFPVCYIEGMGQTPFKIYAEYVIIGILLMACYQLYRHKSRFSPTVYQLLLWSIIFTILSEICFTLYISNHSLSNQFGHYFKLVAFFLIYKANVETGFLDPTEFIFKNLKESEEKYRTLTENLPVLLLRFDAELKCIYANSSAEKLVTCDKNPTPTLVALNLHPAILNVLKLVQQSGQLQHTNMKLEDKETVQFFAVQAFPELDANAETYLVICQDITQLKLAEQELHQLNITKDKLFSIIAHDLKNPFTSLISFSELIYRNTEKLSVDKIKNMGLRMNESAKQAYLLLENLLTWSRIQTGILKPDLQPVDTVVLLEAARASSAPMASSKNIQIEILGSADRPVVTDRLMIDTVLRNLISNAIKFSYPESSILIKTEEQQGKIVFSIADSGIGIEMENQTQLLNINSNLTTPGTAAEKGTGLGLVLCKEFIELCGGQIWLKSEFGIGTTFFFSLPS